MTITVKNIVPAAQLTGAAATLYTATNCKTVIDKFTLTNTSGGAIAVTVYKIVQGGAAGAGNTIISAKSIAAGETYNCPEMVGQTLEAGGFIQAFASTTLTVTVSASGREIT